MKPMTALALLALLVAACGDDDTAAATTSTSPTLAAATSTVAPTTTTTAASTTTAATTTTTTAPTPAPTFDADLTFQFEIQDETTPALAPGESWDISFSYSPNPIVGDDQFRLFYTGWGFSGVGVGYATSTDGRFFERVGDGPLFEFRVNESGRTLFPQRPIVRVRDDGTWEMYLSENVSKRFSSSRILRATAPGPEGPWTLDDQPIYVAADDAWDQEAVPHSILEHQGSVLLFYGGPVDGTAASGVLVSTDGDTFAAHDDPATTPPSDPVIGPTGVQSWDGAGAGSPLVFSREDGTLEMFYLGFEGPENPAGNAMRLGYARSTDGGVTWQRFAGNPIIEVETQVSVPSSLGFPWLGGFKMGDHYYIYYALGAGSEGIGLLTVSVTEG